jgi:hypothetical protein
MTYLTKSPEMPAGEIDKIFIRYELQEAKANVPHLHCILWLANAQSEEEIRRVFDRIRASISSIVKHEEIQEYINKGILSSYEELVTILDDLQRIILHKHNRRCLVPAKLEGKQGAFSNVQKVNEVGASGNIQLTNDLHKFKCKVPDNRLLSPNPTRHCIIYIDVHHTQAALQVLASIGLVAHHESIVPVTQLPTVEYIDKSLVAKRHIPPTCADDEVLSPVLAQIIIQNPNSNNVQFLDSYGVAKYVAKYVGAVDEAARVYIYIALA